MVYMTKNVLLVSPELFAKFDTSAEYFWPQKIGSGGRRKTQVQISAPKEAQRGLNPGLPHPGEYANRAFISYKGKCHPPPLTVL